jgi:hypothetical protein
MSRFDRNQRLAAFKALETRCRLFAVRVDGWSAWRVMRNFAYYSAAALPLVSPARSQASRVRAALVGSLRLAGHLLRGRRVDVLVKTARSALRMDTPAGARDVYFDGFLGEYRHFKLEEVNSAQYDDQARRARHPAHLDAVVFTFWGKVLSKLKPAPAPAADFARTVSAELAREVDVHIPVAALLERISTAYWQGRLYGLLLARLRPRVVLGSDTGDYGLMIACAKAGIPFIELQHGIFDAKHPDAVPTDAEGTDRELLIPDALASRGAHWVNALAGTRHAAAARLMGNELIDQALDARAADAGGADRPHTLVVTSQGLDVESLAQWLSDMVAAAPPGLDWRLRIKLHPVYDLGATAFDALEADDRVEVVPGAAAPNVFQLLSQADLHLSIASACHFDALAIGVPSVVVPLSGHEIMLDAIDGRSLVLATDPAEVWTSPPAPPSQSDRMAYSQPGFLDNMRALIAAFGGR